MDMTANAKKTLLAAGPYWRRGAIAVPAIVIIDQLTKWAVFEGLLRRNNDGMGFFNWLTTRIHADEIFARGEAVYQNITVTPFMNIIMVWNKGVSFGLFANDGLVNKYALIVVALLVSAVMAAGLFAATRAAAATAFALIVGGALGNVIDRFRFGAVADFVDLHVAGYHWPAFNVADSAIVLGAILLVYDAMTAPDTTHSSSQTEGKQ